MELFRGDMGAYLRLYTFLSQIFDYGQTALEKRRFSTGDCSRCSTSSASGPTSTSPWCR
jgi:hypothetical protein